MWEGRALSAGRVSKSGNSVILTTNILKTPPRSCPSPPRSSGSRWAFERGRKEEGCLTGSPTPAVRLPRGRRPRNAAPAQATSSGSCTWRTTFRGSWAIAAGKDSTATLQLVWLAIAELDESKRQKPIHVISTDTLVENPIVAAWVTHSLDKINAKPQSRLPPFRLSRTGSRPEVEDTFWVNLIGKGYPAPRHKFRWCTERLKIKPSNRFIRNVVRRNGEAILVLGTRKAESAKRASTMKKLEEQRVRDRLSPNANLPGCLVLSPIEDWSNDDVWLFLMQVDNPWGYRNKDLLTMYQGASEDGECPLVVDTSTPSCGDSRFGCWVCTLVDKDRSMTAMIQNDEEKEWMLPLLELRNELDTPNDRPLRDFRRMTGAVQLFHDRPIPGPLHPEGAGDMATPGAPGPAVGPGERSQGCRLHRADYRLRTGGDPTDLGRGEARDRGSVAWESTRRRPGSRYPDTAEPETTARSGPKAWKRSRKSAATTDLHYELTRNLLSLEWQYRTHLKRRGLFDGIEAMVRRGYYERRRRRDGLRPEAETRVGCRPGACSVRETDEAPGYAKPSVVRGLTVSEPVSRRDPRRTCPREFRSVPRTERPVPHAAVAPKAPRRRRRAERRWQDYAARCRATGALRKARALCQRKWRRLRRLPEEGSSTGVFVRPRAPASSFPFGIGVRAPSTATGCAATGGQGFARCGNQSRFSAMTIRTEPCPTAGRNPSSSSSRLGIARLVFFDGEKIEALADPNTSSEALRAGVNALLGLGIVERLAADLMVFERRSKTRLVRGSDQTAVEAAERELKTAGNGT